MKRIEADVLILGGGPSGLAAAMACKRQGVQHVVVLEREPNAGGVPRHCGHPPFGMREFGTVLTGPAYAQRLVDEAKAVGVRILTNHHVVALKPNGVMQITTPEGMSEAIGKRVLLAMGARESTRAARLLTGQRPWGVINTGALQAMLYLKQQKPFKAPIIVGTELVSLSAVWSCLKAGIRPVAVIEENSRPTARRFLALFPKLFGIPVHYNTQIQSIKGQERVTHVELSASGKSLQYACDGVLVTGKFLPEASLIRASHLDMDDNSLGPKIDQNGRTSDPAYYAAGNLLRPIETAGWSFREGRRIGLAIAEDLRQASLAPSQDRISITLGSELKYVVPSALSKVDSAALPWFQVRVPAAKDGVLCLEIDGQIIWRKHVRALPERRITVPLKMQQLRDANTISIGFL